MAEWSNAAVSKTVAWGYLGREFESLSLRFFLLRKKTEQWNNGQ